MDNLVNKVKPHTNKVAVSGAIKRYDGKVNNYKIEQYNKLIHGLCSKHNIAYIDNSCIGRSLLNTGCIKKKFTVGKSLLMQRALNV